MKLIIAEKPDLAKLISKAVGNTQRYDGYYQNNEYIITFAFGHLFELYSIEDYLKSHNTAWTLDILPFVPENNNFSFRIIHDKKTKKPDIGIVKQFKIIKQLCNRTDVTEIINCGDGDREGEAIIRLVIRNSISWNSKQLSRLWLNEQTIESIRQGLKNLKPESEYDNIANEGFARLYEDWLYGINCTRYATLKAGGTLLRIGRVLTAIVKEIYDRDMEIKNFVSKKYYSIYSNEETNGNRIELESKIKYEIGQEIDALERCGLLNTHGAKVTDVKKERVTVKPPKLFSTTTLQNAANKLYKYTPEKTAGILQKLYESGFVTYPRVNTEYLGNTDKGRIKNILNLFQKNGYDVIFKDTKAIFDDSKVESHSAITPTINIPSNLSQDTKNIYDLIKNRFVAAFCAEECILNRTTLKIYCYDEEFVLKGNTRVQDGYLKYDFTKITEKELPNLNIGDEINVHFSPIEKNTQPPSHYTVTTLNNFMVSPFKNELKSLENDDEEYKELLNGTEIGTPASRTNILLKAKENGYITSDGTHYYITQLGIDLIHITQKLGINLYKHKSVEVSRMLKRVYRGEITINDSINLIMQDINNMFLNKEIAIEPIAKTAAMEIIGTCPLCKANVYENKYGYSCEKNTKENPLCHFMLWKNDKFIKSRTGHEVTLRQAKSVLKNGYFTAKCKKNDGTGTYNLKFVLDTNDKYIKWNTSLVKAKN